MKEITKLQIAQIHAILSKANLMDDKRRIISEISNGRTESTTKLFWQEAQNWINAMNKGIIKKKVERPTHPGQRMINAVIAMAREMNVITRKQVVTPKGLEWKSDYTRFNEWMIEKSCVKKQLNACTETELTKLVTQYKAIYTDWLRKYH